MAETVRLTARKSRIADILAGNSEIEAPRVNILGVVVDVTSEEPPAFVVDDRSGLVVVRQFEKRATPPIGVPVCVIGRVRDHAGQRYIASEIAKQVDSAWLDVRSLELAKQSSFVTPSAPGAASDGEERVIDDIIDERAKVLNVIRALDEGPGAQMDDVLAKTGADGEKTIAFLLQRGDVFEISPGKLKILE